MKNNILGIVIVVLIVIICILAFPRFSMVDNEKVTVEPKINITESMKSVLTIYVYDKNMNELATGSCFVAINDSILITNYHVIEGSYYAKAVSQDLTSFDIDSCLYYNKNDDVAILKTIEPTNLKPLKLLYNDSLTVGDEVIAIGSPLGIQNVVSNGIVSNFNKDEDWLQYTAPISSGSSGGALLNSKGEVIGITSGSYVRGQNINLAVPYYLFNNVDLSQPTSMNELYYETNFVGNSIATYSKGFVLFTENDEYTFEALNKRKEIIMRNKKTDETESLNIFGQSLGVFDNYLYYLTEDNASIHKCDFVKKEDKTIITSLKEISKLYVTADGLIVENSDNFSLYDFDGSLIKKIKDKDYMGLISTMYDKDTLLYQDIELSKIVVLNVKTGETTPIYDAGINARYCLSNDKKILLKDKNKLIIYDFEKDEANSYDLTNLDVDEFFYNEGKLYYITSKDNATYVYDIKSDKLETYSNLYRFVSLYFSKDGVIYGRAKNDYQVPSGLSQTERLNYIKEHREKVKYIRIKDGQVEILDDAT